jgi:hypothetical protein
MNTPVTSPISQVDPTMRSVVKHSLTTGLVVGLVSYNVGALFPEQAFQSPAIWASVSGLAVNYWMPFAPTLHRAALIGAGMAAACMFVTQDCPPSGALRYGIAAAAAAYVAETYIVPRLLTVENRYI